MNRIEINVNGLVEQRRDLERTIAEAQRTITRINQMLRAGGLDVDAPLKRVPVTVGTPPAPRQKAAYTRVGNSTELVHRALPEPGTVFAYDDLRIDGLRPGQVSGGIQSLVEQGHLIRVARGRFRVPEAQVPIEDRNLPASTRQVWHALRGGDWLREPDLTQATGLTSATVRSVLSGLGRAGDVERKGDRYGARRPAVPPPPALEDEAAQRIRDIAAAAAP